MDFWQLSELRKNHPAWRLLAADHAPMILAFLQQVFISANRRSMGQSELASSLDDFLFRLRSVAGEDLFTKSGRGYLEDWARAESAWLRKYYPKGADEAEFDLTPAAEKALEWITKLEQRQFVGTGSRLQNLLEQLQQLVHLSETDPRIRIAELQQKKTDIDQQIAELEALPVLVVDATQVKERYFQIEDTARQLLGDFRQVEQNFRDLDVQVREKITLSEQSKGQLLEEIFGDQDAITDSDQGKSFRAFWSLIMSPRRQQQMSGWLSDILSLSPVQELAPDDFLKHLHYRLLEAGEKAQRTSVSLAEQLRRYLDDQAWRENKRILQLIGRIERSAVSLKQRPPLERDFSILDATRADVQLPMTRGLFRPDLRATVTLQAAEEGDNSFETAALYQQEYVDIERLRANIRHALQSQSQTSLHDICRKFPLQQGLAELLAYMNLASQNERAIIDDRRQQQIYWQTEEQQWKQATLPIILFSR